MSRIGYRRHALLFLSKMAEPLVAFDRPVYFAFDLFRQRSSVAATRPRCAIACLLTRG
ncbi:MAG: hypothetical protein M3Q30_18050 [Actinomycetota bacterium]|nr:hypothetical protein [Actinomycetota bacterium]